MVKTLNGCLSDLAGKAQYPEFVPLDIAAQDKMAAVHLQKHPLKGIRIGSKIKRGNTISRYPINDLKNFATLSDPANAQKHKYMDKFPKTSTKPTIKSNVPDFVTTKAKKA